MKARAITRRGMCAVVAVHVVLALTTHTATPPRATAGPATSTRHFHPPVSLQSFAPIRTVANETSGEPTIEVGADGSVYVAGTYGVGAASPVWRSEDGETFAELETPGHVREYTIGAEGDVAVDDDGRVYFADTFLAGIMLTRWSDGGDTWDFTVPVAPEAAGFYDRPWLAWSRQGLFLYVNFGNDVKIFRSTDDGLTWTEATVLSWKGSSDGQPYFPGHMSAARDSGALVVAGMVRDWEKREQFVAATYSPDGGATWREARIARWPRRPGGGISPIFPGMTAIDDEGTGYVAWSEFDFHGCAVYYSYTSDEGRSWSKPVALSRAPGCATFPTLDARDDGDLAAAWYETPDAHDMTPGKEPDARADYAARYGAFALPLLTYQDDVRGDAPWFVEVAAVRAADTPHPRVLRARATPRPIMHGPMQRRLIDFFEIALDARGRVHVAYAEDLDGDALPHSWYVASRSSLFTRKEARR